MSKNAEGWVRHRGGKCPFKPGVMVDVRYRDSIVSLAIDCDDLRWGYIGDSGDIMAYRLHKPAEQVEPFIEAVQAFNALSKVPQLDGPTGWRDRITEIDATTKALATERAELVQKLASEGFALIGRINDLLTEAAQKHEDMSDWRNWKVGDFVESVIDEDEDIEKGGKYKLWRDTEYASIYIVDDAGDKRNRCLDDYKFHSRPSA